MEEQNHDLISSYIDESQVRSESDIPERHDKKGNQLKAKKRIKAAAKYSTIALISLAVLASCAAFAYFFFLAPKTKNQTEENTTQQLASPDEIFYSILTGEEISKEAAASTATTCIMIENSPEARPQSGLRDAGVIYETIAEGGITRFMAIYQSAKPNFIGPVRSLRLTYAELARPYHCALAHAGGAYNALQAVQNAPYRNVDALVYDGGAVDYEKAYFWRIRNRYAPHNLYTSFSVLDQLNFRLGFTESNYHSFARVAPNTTPTYPDSTNANEIHINFGSGPVFNVAYNYDPANGRYLRRYDNGTPHNDQALDGSVTQNAPRVVVAMRVQAVQRSSEASYYDYTTVGSGEAFVFQDGHVITGSWHRDCLDDELYFLDNSGAEIKLERGQTWISLYSAGGVSWQ